LQSNGELILNNIFFSFLLLLEVYLGELFWHALIPFDQVLAVKLANPDLNMKTQATALVQKARTLREPR